MTLEEIKAAIVRLTPAEFIEFSEFMQTHEIRTKIAIGIQQADAGQTISDAEAKKRMAKWLDHNESAKD